MHSSTVLAIQSWTLYATAVSLIFSRVVFRRITLGSLKKLQLDDWLMISVLIPFTASIALANHVSTAQTTRQRMFRYVLEEMQIITIWLVKACLLALYWRIIPVEVSIWKRRIIKVISIFCIVSFLVVQISLLATCQPTEAHWELTTSNAQCQTYHTHTIVTLTFTVPTTLFTMMLPVPFIPTPRRCLLAILLILGTLVFSAGTISRVYILQRPTAPAFLPWYTAESCFSLIFANLPFLTSLVVATAPARIRDFSNSLRASSHLALSQWPRSRRGSWNCIDHSRRGSWVTTSTPHESLPPLRFNRLDSVGTTTTISELPSPVDLEKVPEWSRETRRYVDSPRTQSPRQSPRHSVEQSPSTPALLSEAEKEKERQSEVPKARLSGGLAEMGDVAVAGADGWPIYWK